jgi:hypothetical protein
MIKRLIITLLLLLPVFVLTAPVPNAQAAFGGLFSDDLCDGATGDDPSTPDVNETSTVCAERGNTDNPLTGTTGLLLRAASLITVIIGIASFIIIIYGSIKYITSGGEPASVENAKNTVMYALVGIVVALASQAIIVFVVNNID